MLTNRQSETAGLQFHVVYYKPTTFHVKHLHAGAIAIDKDEDFTILNVALHLIENNAAQGIKALPHIGWIRVEIILH
jgi:hypothetical protein